MSKKEYILAVLNKVSGLRGPADNIKELLIADQLTDEYIDYLYDQCVQAVAGALQSQDYEQQEAIVYRLSTIKEAEIRQNNADQIDIQNLEKLISNL